LTEFHKFPLPLKLRRQIWNLAFANEDTPGRHIRVNAFRHIHEGKSVAPFYRYLEPNGIEREPLLQISVYRLFAEYSRPPHLRLSETCRDAFAASHDHYLKMESEEPSAWRKYSEYYYKLSSWPADLTTATSRLVIMSQTPESTATLIDFERDTLFLNIFTLALHGE
jgi:hypothetical protein